MYRNFPNLLKTEMATERILLYCSELYIPDAKGSKPEMLFWHITLNVTTEILEHTKI